MTNRTESQVLAAVVRWAADRAPALLAEYDAATDRRAAARSLLRAWVAADPSVALELPDGLLVKLGYRVDRVFDRKELALADRINGWCERRICA